MTYFFKRVKSTIFQRKSDLLLQNSKFYYFLSTTHKGSSKKWGWAPQKVVHARRLIRNPEKNEGNPSLHMHFSFLPLHSYMCLCVYWWEIPTISKKNLRYTEISLNFTQKSIQKPLKILQNPHYTKQYLLKFYSQQAIRTQFFHFY